MKMLIGTKKEMTSIFTEEGELISVTKICIGDNVITQIRNEEKDGYSALQIGFGKSDRVKKPQKGQFKKTKTPNLRFLKEVRVSSDEASGHKVGEQFSVTVFNKGEKVNVFGVTKGKGFQGVIKRHGFSRGPESHGSDHHREPGSIGAGYPQHVLKGQKLPGRMGHSRVTIKNLIVEKIDPEERAIYLRGAVPGPNKSLVCITGKGDFEAEVVEISPKKEKENKNSEKRAEKPEKVAKKVKDNKENSKKPEKKDKK